MIWLLRHAHAEPGSPDAERPLSERGVRQARAAGAALKVLGVELDACLTSPKVRARETARLACEPLGIEPWEERALRGGPFDPTDAVAGHDATGAQVRMPKSGLAAIDRGELKLLLRPHELAKLAQLL